MLANEENLRRMRSALDELDAERIAAPPFERRDLDPGHAVHFRCRDPEAKGIRLDVMAIIRGLPDFETLWRRRTTVVTDAGPIDVMSLPDLVVSKKTQRDRD